MSRFTTTVPTRASSARNPSALVVALLAGGCGTYGPGDLAVGQTEADARTRLGEPTLRMPGADGGTRLDYARGPMGRHTWRVELDGAGKVKRIAQLLSEANFETLRPGWSQQQVVDVLGPATHVRSGWRGAGEVWSYRYDWRVLCRWFQVWLVDGVVREAGYALEPECEEVRNISRD